MSAAEQNFTHDDLSPLERPGATVKAKDGGATVKFENGWELSILWHPFAYCSARDLAIPFDERAGIAGNPSRDAEVAARKDGSRLLEWQGGDTVAGWQPFAHVMHVLDLMAADDVPSPLPEFDAEAEEPAAHRSGERAESDLRLAAKAAAHRLRSLSGTAAVVAAGFTPAKRAAPEDAPAKFPFKDGPVTVLGPDVIASTPGPTGETVIAWRGENFRCAPAPLRDTEVQETHYVTDEQVEAAKLVCVAAGLTVSAPAPEGDGRVCAPDCQCDASTVGTCRRVALTPTAHGKYQVGWASTRNTDHPSVRWATLDAPTPAVTEGKSSSNTESEGR